MSTSDSKLNPFVVQEGKIRDPVVRDRSRKRWVEEVFGENAWEPRQTDGEKKAGFIGLSISAKKVRWFFLIVFLGIILLLFRAGYLQLVRGEHYHTLAENNRIRIEAIKSKRGIIFDRNGKTLARNVPKFLLSVVPADLPKDTKERDKILEQLAEILSVDQSDKNKITLDVLKKTIESYFSGSSEAKIYTSSQPIPIAENFNYEKAVLLRIASANLPGVRLEDGARRKYSIPVSASHILGYVGKISPEELRSLKHYLFTDYLGKTGIESNYESILRGKYGKKQIEVDALGKERKIISEENPIDGANLVLTIDISFQEQVEKILERRLRALGKKKGSVIILNPQTGEILAMVSLPAYDNNLFSSGIREEEYEQLISNPADPLFNRSIAGIYPPGSTIKPVIAAAALEEEIINRNTIIRSVGGIWIDKWFFPDWKVGGHGAVNVVRAIAESVNTFFYLLGGGVPDPEDLGLRVTSDTKLTNRDALGLKKNFEWLGVQKIKEYSQKFGIGSALGIDISGESAGLFPDPQWKEKTKGEKWYVGDTYHLSIGQGDILVTPLQAASWTAVFANGGILYRPRFLKEIIPTESETPAQFERDESRKVIQSVILAQDFIRPENINIVREGLRQAVTYGSAKKLSALTLPAGLYVDVAGKTGTAQWKKGAPSHAWFTGFAPLENPEIALTVLIEEGGEGSETAVPVAKEILEWYFSKTN